MSAANLSNRIKPTKADRRFFEELMDALNDAYLEGKPMTRALELVTIQRHINEGAYYERYIKARRRVKELEGHVNA